MSVEGVVGREDLAQGLLLVRASAQRVVRLQLALERRDRKVALEAVDDLVDLDRQLQDFLADLPLADAKAEAQQRALDAQRRELARDKFVLAAGMSGPRISLGENEAMLIEPAPPPAPSEAPGDVTVFDHEEFGKRGLSSHVVAAVAVLLLLAIGAALAVFVSGSGLGWGEIAGVF